MNYSKIGCIADNSEIAKAALENLIKIYNLSDFSTDNIHNYDCLIVLGGDGFMLHTLHKLMHLNIPFFGMNVGNVGFLLNKYNHDNFIERVNTSQKTIIHPLKMKAQLIDGKIHEELAINEVSLIRSSTQAAKLKISVNGAIRLEELVCDGAMVSTAAGSSAYNYSVGGPIIPIGSNILALTPISPFRPRRWRGALLPHNAVVTIDVLEYQKRTVSAVADFTEVKNVVSVEVTEDKERSITLLFDPDHSLEERLTKEQFAF